MLAPIPKTQNGASAIDGHENLRKLRRVFFLAPACPRKGRPGGRCCHGRMVWMQLSPAMPISARPRPASVLARGGRRARGRAAADPGYAGRGAPRRVPTGAGARWQAHWQPVVVSQFAPYGPGSCPLPPAAPSHRSKPRLNRSLGYSKRLSSCASLSFSAVQASSVPSISDARSNAATRDSRSRITCAHRSLCSTLSCQSWSALCSSGCKRPISSFALEDPALQSDTSPSTCWALSDHVWCVYHPTHIQKRLSPLLETQSGWPTTLTLDCVLQPSGVITSQCPVHPWLSFYRLSLIRVACVGLHAPTVGPEKFGPLHCANESAQINQKLGK